MIFALAALWQSNAQISPIEVTGYTEDIVANGVGAMSTSTTIQADAATFCLLSADWKLNAADPPITTGLPANGLITSSTVAGLTYQIPPTATPYAGNNSLRIDQSGAANAGTITLVTPERYSELYFLVFSGSGAANMDVTVNFSDATTEIFPANIIPDWYLSGLPVEVSGFGRGDLSNNNVENPASNPKLFRLQLSISAANQAKSITSITFTRNNPATDIAVFNMIAVSGMMVDFCAPPSNILLSNINATDADVSWTYTGTATEWKIEYGPAGFSQGSGTIVADNDGTIGETITGLTPSTSYDVYVKTICAVGDESTWAGPATFLTDCVAITSFPYEESFEDTSANRVCWSNEFVVGNKNWEYVATNQNASIAPRTGILMAEFRKDNPSGETTKLITPALDLTSLSNPQLIFYYANVGWSGDIDELRVYYKTSATGTWTQIGNDYVIEHTTWTKVALSLPNPSSEYYIAFEGTSNFGRGVNVDDVWIGESTCASPTNLNVTNIMPNSADLSWDPVPNAVEGYEWFVFEAGADPSTTAPVATGSISPGATTVTVSGLDPETNYEFYVSALCGVVDGVSTLAGPMMFTTTALGISVQVFENFSYLPNPVSSQLSLKANSKIQQVVIYDLLGQEVLKNRPNNLNPTLELGTLQSGVYFMKVIINGSYGIYKFIKE
ncbi:MAG TPA: fibronectin type III domain-containing protein [Flavobacteriaceae bacterium]|nr:fibronectin type III domain-containing protein [Flavobacteriaceae bacterium]